MPSLSLFANHHGKQLHGHLKLIDNKNLDDFLKSLSIGFASRHVACTTKPTTVVKKNGGISIIKIHSPSNNAEVSFQLQLEFHEATTDDRKAKFLV